MFILIFSLIYFDAVDVTPARDSTIQQILEGRWAEAITNAKFVLVHEPEDYLLLGLLKFGHVKGFVSKLTLKFSFLLSKKKSDIVKAWDKFYKENQEKQDILQILGILYLDVDVKKTKFYCNKMLELDSLNSFSYFILGYASERDENYDEALIYYRKSFFLDTMFTDCSAMLANLYIITGNYDSALVYFSKICYDNKASNSMHIGELICQLKNKNIAGAVTILDRLKDSELFTFTRNSIDVIQEYIDGGKENRLSPTDSFIIFIPIFFKQLNLHPTTLGALLTADSIIITNIFEGRPRPLFVPSLINFETEVVPYYMVEVPPEVIHIPKPNYPKKAWEQKLEGKVVVGALISIDGNVKDTFILSSSGFTALDDAAMQAAMKAKFKPAIQFGRPVRVWVSIPIKFRLN